MTKQQIENVADDLMHTYGYGINASDASYIKFAALKMAKWCLDNLWTSVKDQLPERNRNVLALNVSGDVFVAFHDGLQSWWWCDGFVCGKKANGDNKYSSCLEIDSITHWMPIPPLKGGEK